MDYPPHSQDRGDGVLRAAASRRRPQAGGHAQRRAAPSKLASKCAARRYFCDDGAQRHVGLISPTSSKLGVWALGLPALAEPVITVPAPARSLS